ncbi:MAG: hypothetical protein JNM47_05435 [Hyphomonadaceae bacterium]|nr:hypothetical protein [Hyphomonadaceae bacterium]
MRHHDTNNCVTSIEDLAAILSACGLTVRLWKGQRLYLSGYGRDIKAYLAPQGDGPLPADGYALTVTSSWNMPRYNGLRCKGVKHAILEDLFLAGVISAPPPADWKQVQLEAPHSMRPPIIPYAGAFTKEGDTREMAPTPPPHRHPRDPYAVLRDMHQKRTSA